MNRNRSLAAHQLFRGHPRCPHAKKSRYYEDLDFCDINDKICLLETSNPCPEWEELQKEQEDGQQDSPDNS